MRCASQTQTETKEPKNQRTQEQDSASAIPDSLPRRQAGAIDELIQQLGDDDWETREKAQNELIKIGEELIQEYQKNRFTPAKAGQSKDTIKNFADALQEASKSKAEQSGVPTNVGDPEVKMRANQIRKYFYCLLQPRIIFISNLTGNNHTFGDIYAINTDASNQTRLTNNANVTGNIAWSPDGSKIAFSSDRGGLRGIYIMNADGSNQIRLTNAADGCPTWNQDGTKIAFASNRDGNWRIRDGYWQIYVMNADGKNQTRLTNIPALVGTPTWCPISLPEIYVLFADAATERSPDSR